VSRKIWSKSADLGDISNEIKRNPVLAVSRDYGIGSGQRHEIPVRPPRQRFPTMGTDQKEKRKREKGKRGHDTFSGSFTSVREAEA